MLMPENLKPGQPAIEGAGFHVWEERSEIVEGVAPILDDPPHLHLAVAAAAASRL